MVAAIGVPTFSLVPERQRVVTAKVGASVLLTFLAVAASVVAAAVGNLAGIAFGNGDGSWFLDTEVLAQLALFHLLNMLVGVAFGLALLSSPLAIVLYYVMPIAFALLGGLISALREPLQWLDLTLTTEPLLGDVLSDTILDGRAWARMGTSLLLWLVLPLVVGVFRVTRDDVQ